MRHLEKNFQDLFCVRNDFSSNLENVAQKAGLPCPFDILNLFVRKSKFKSPRAFFTSRVPTREGIEREKCPILNFSKVVWDIFTFSPAVVFLCKNLICIKWMPWIWISCQKPYKTSDGHSGPVFLIHIHQIWWELISYLVA